MRRQLIEVPLRQAPKRFARQSGQGCENAVIRWLRSQGQEILAGQVQFAGAEDLRMSGENLFGQGRARTRQADDEHRPFRLQAEAAHSLEERRGEGCHEVLDEAGIVVGTVARLSGGARPASGRWPVAAGRRPVRIRPGVAYLGQAEQQFDAVGSLRSGSAEALFEQSAVGLRQLAAQQPRQLPQGLGVLRIQAKHCPKRLLRPRRIAHSVSTNPRL